MNWLKDIAVIFICFVLLIFALTGCDTTGCGRSSDVSIGVACKDENGRPVADAQVKVNGKLIGTTDNTGRIKARIPEVPKRGTKPVVIEAEKEGYTQKDKRYSVSVDTPELQVEVWRDLTLDINWVQVKRNEPKAPVVGGKIALVVQAGMEEVLKRESRTDDEGRTIFTFNARKDSLLKVSANLEPFIRANNPDIQSPGMRVITVTDETNYETSLISGIEPVQVTFIVDIFGLSELSGITLKVNGQEIEPEIMPGTLSYSEEAYEGDKRTLSLSHKEYDFVPASETFTLTTDTTYTMNVTAMEKPPFRNFDIVCRDQKNEPLSDAVVLLDGRSTGRVTKRDGRLTLSRRLREGEKIKVTLEKPGYTFEYDPENGGFTIGRANEYQLAATAVRMIEQVAVTIRCFDQKGSGLPGVNISSSDGLIAGTTDSAGVSVQETSPNRTVLLAFSRDGYVTDRDVKLEVPKSDNVSLDRYLVKMTSPVYRIGIGPFEFSPPELSKSMSGDAARAGKMIADKLEGEYRSFSVARRIVNKTPEELREGWDESEIPLDFVFLGGLTRGAQKMSISGTLLRKRGIPSVSAIREYEMGENLANVTDSLVEVLMEGFPFEGYVIEAGSDSIRVDMGRKQNMRRGNSLEIYHTERDKNGKISGDAYPIGVARVLEVGDSASVAGEIKKRGAEEISVGDRVMRIPVSGLSRLTVTVKERGTNNPLAGMNLYYGKYEMYGGRTDRQGEASFNVPRGVELEILGTSPGWRVEERVTVLGDEDILRCFADRETYSLNITSEPSGCAVYLDDESIGSTPIRGYSAMEGSYELRLVDESGDKGSRALPIVIPDSSPSRKFESIGMKYVISERNVNIHVDLVIPLDDRRRSEVKRLVNSGQYRDAIELLKVVSEYVKKDYLSSRQWIGSIYANNLQDYDSAIAIFKELVNREKRFAAAYYNLGWCYYKKGEYDEAIRNFPEVIRYRTYLADEDVMRVIHDTRYFYAKAHYEIARGNGNVANVVTACESYEDFHDKTLAARPEYDVDKRYYDTCRDEIENILAEVRK
jgi:tetratricopeptide (TPR) repeat protein